MILVDSSVWVDSLRGTPTPVLQGCATDRQFNEVRRLLLNLTVVALGRREVAIEAARNDRRLRAVGLTVRKTIGTVIATRCIVGELELLHSDRDFDPFEQHLGLRCVPCEA